MVTTDGHKKDDEGYSSAARICMKYLQLDAEILVGYNYNESQIKKSVTPTQVFFLGVQNDKSQTQVMSPGLT